MGIYSTTSVTGNRILKIYCKDVLGSGPDLLRGALMTHFVATKDMPGYAPIPGLPEATAESLENMFSIPPALEGASIPYRDMRGRLVSRGKIRSPYIDKIEVNPHRIRTFSDISMMPNYIIPVRLYSDEVSAMGDTFWNVFFKGGKFGENNYLSLIDDSTVFYAEALMYGTPYSILESKTTRGLSRGSAAEITCEYRTYYPQYESFVENLENERLIPNFYFFESLRMGEFDKGADLENLSEYQFAYAIDGVSLINYAIGSATKESPVDLFKQIASNPDIFYTPDYESLYRDISTIEELSNMRGTSEFAIWMKSYMEDSYPNIALTEIQKAATKQENILMDHDYVKNAHAYAEAPTRVKMFPYSAKISLDLNQDRSTTWETDEGDGTTSDHILAPPHWTQAEDGVNAVPATLYPVYAKAIEESKFSSKFLELLKSAHLGEIETLQFEEKEFVSHLYQYNASLGTMSDLIPELPDAPGRVALPELQTSIEKYRVMLLPDLISAGINHVETQKDNYFFAGNNSRGQQRVSRGSLAEGSAVESAVVHAAAAQTLNSICEAMHSYLSLTPDFDAVRAHSETPDAAGIAESILDNIIQPSYSYSETLAYRVTKRRRYSDKEVQNFWIFNATDASIPDIFDTQVKYDKEYTYDVYAYVAVLGYRYRYGDFRLTKQIATIELDPDAYGAESYCLQFYDPKNGQYADQQFLEGAGVETILDPASVRSESIASVRASLLATRNEFATSQQEISAFPQLADFNLYIEPCTRLMEIPVYSKNIRITDNPGNHMMVEPFQYLDNSNRLGFDIKYEGFLPYPYPSSITDIDKKLKEDYLNTQSILDSENVSLRSVSLERYVEIYRIESIPRALEDFDGSLINTIDLKIANSNYTQSDTFCEDQIEENKKYYYLFRFLNEHRMPGHISPILVCELVDDGGYKYALFDMLSELTPENVHVQPSERFKKLFQIKPNVLQLSLDLDKIQYSSMTALEAVEDLPVGLSEDLLWGRTFKLRLTSKKTGKKIDLNVKFNLHSDYLQSDKIFMTTNLTTSETEEITGTVDEDGV